MSDWMAEVKGRVPHRPKRRWWAVAARPAGAMGQFPLDVITAPGVATVSAYGLRQMRSGYVGPAINVRRSSDNATIDIGFRGAGDLDIQTFNTFVGGGNGFVTRWYDQSGNGRDVFDAGFSNQPQLQLGATATNRPALSHLSTNGLGGTVPAATVPLTLSTVAARTGTLTSYVNVLVLQGAGGNPSIFHQNTPSLAFGGSNSISTSAIDYQFHSTIGVMNGASSSLTVDGVTTSGTLTNGPGSTSILVPTYAMQGLTCEAIYFSGALDTTSIAALAANQRAYWGGPATVFTPITGNASYLLILDDEFNGTSLNTTTKWSGLSRQQDLTYPGGQAERLPDNVSVHDGLLDLMVTRGPTPGGYNYGTAGVYSQGSTISGQPIALYWEARYKAMDNARGLVSTWWTDTAPSFVTPEADFSEYWQAVSPNQTRNNYNDGTTWQLNNSYNYGSNLALGFHTYGCWWTTTSINFYIDGVLTSSTSTNTNKTTPVWYAILNAAVGGGGNFPDATTLLPNHMLVDYVHVYSAQTGAVAVTPDVGYGGPGDSRRS